MGVVKFCLSILSEVFGLDIEKGKIDNVCAAASKGDLKVLKFILDDMPREEVMRMVSAKTNGTTPLVLSCANGHQEVVEYLLNKCSASVEQTGTVTFQGGRMIEAPPLYFAALRGHVGIVKLLMTSGAAINFEVQGMTPLLAAAQHGHLYMVEYLISLRELVTRQERIDALELLGARFVYRQPQDLQRALKLWKRAMEERHEDGAIVIPKAIDKSPISAYINMQEVESVTQLEQIVSDQDSMLMQALLVTERILGPTNHYTAKTTQFIGIRYKQRGKLGRCITLWMYSVDMMQKTEDKMDVFDDLMKLFRSKISDEDEEWFLENFSYIVMVFRGIVKVVREGQRAMETEKLQDLHYNIRYAVLLLDLLTKFIPDMKMAEEVFKFKQLVHEFVMIGSKGEFGVSPLHLACSLLLHIPTINLLLECGAPVDARDDDGNTALHTAAIRHNKHKLTAMEEVIQSLLKKGAHPDNSNKNRQTFYDLIGIPMGYSEVPFSLKCLAAQVVRKNDLELDSLPLSLQTFVLNH